MASKVFHGVGRRKSAVARVWLKPGSGDFSVNNKDLNSYFSSSDQNSGAKLPFELVEMQGKFNAKVLVNGGGICGQADAVQVAVVRALLDYDEKLKPVFKSHGLTTIDARKKERKKPGQKGARKKFQFVKR